MNRNPIDGRHFDVVIIGAGMAGLAAGIRLALGGREVAILERHNAPGGLNSFYSQDGRKFDVGLHALTNYAPHGARGAPLTKLLRQLRIPWEALDLNEQNGSRIAFPGCSLRFSNQFGLLESEVAAAFPGEIDGFRALAAEIRALDAFDLGSGRIPARGAVRRHIRDRLLEDMLFCPVMYYGSAEEHDMDYRQFAIMFRSLFFEGFARPFDGVRRIIRLLQDKYRELGGVRKMKCGVARIRVEDGRATALELEGGGSVRADTVISTAGAVETLRMCEDQPQTAGGDAVGALSFVETISVFDRQPADFGWHDTIIFFNSRERFRYARPDSGIVDPTSGVICFPNNYRYGGGRRLPEGLLRLTAIADYDSWSALDDATYRDQKALWFDALQGVALSLLPDPGPGFRFEEHRIASDMFTPRTIHRYTGHLGGAVYGSPRKIRDGRTHLDNLFLAGTDQGFLGIVGAMLSGISMANLHVLRG